MLPLATSTLSTPSLRQFLGSVDGLAEARGKSSSNRENRETTLTYIKQPEKIHFPEY
ncbi:hypothetical protein ACN23B_23270 [Anabaena sp. FACHB-709]|uniref:Uncharacterized protein n=2 Tax=Nostocaceae TaxID=1162 RepID=A0A1Z4KMM2_ANAVA|nr:MULTISPECIES: hypothetical protein [Nostocaceae]BAY70250.1 hypothetical protein NIES23_30510 [Trichormus variabilis NIES-23]MBD2173418.1 hypothetical protein [Anabaena cylindrica FACHB-318]MBD2265273.1 hypothetical protein [Anabaena sp. FACHB-709]MBD2274479.1 hypothetical protein [Nostoc sp. PCC 7120 = FACHB-418]MBD2285410.1 hypothetical protein [Anabaena cylindrica FACHB-170]